MCDLLLTVFHSEARREKRGERGEEKNTKYLFSTILIMNPEPTFFTMKSTFNPSKIFLFLSRINIETLGSFN